MLDIIKNVILPALKSELKKCCTDWIDYTLYAEPYDFRRVVPYSGSGKTIRVIGPIVTRY